MLQGDFNGPITIKRIVYVSCFQLPVWVELGVLKKPFTVCVFWEWLFESLFSLYVGSWCSTASLKLRDPCLFLQFWSDRLLLVTPSDSLSCDDENRDCIMTKQPLSTSLNVTRYLLWKLQLKAIWPFFCFPFTKDFSFTDVVHLCCSMAIGCI